MMHHNLSGAWGLQLAVNALASGVRMPELLLGHMRQKVLRGCAACVRRSCKMAAARSPLASFARDTLKCWVDQPGNPAIYRRSAHASASLKCRSSGVRALASDRPPDSERSSTPSSSAVAALLAGREGPGVPPLAVAVRLAPLGCIEPDAGDHTRACIRPGAACMHVSGQACAGAEW